MKYFQKNFFSCGFLIAITFAAWATYTGDLPRVIGCAAIAYLCLSVALNS